MGNEKKSTLSNVPEMGNYAHMLDIFHPLREPMLREVIRAMPLPLGSSGLDAGCGIGLPALMLAEAVGPDGHVTGMDMSSEFLVHAGRLAEKAGLSKQITFQQGDVTNIPFDDNIFDWAWSVDCVGYPSRDPMPALEELVRVVKPGGFVGILIWSSQQLLPGYPLLEARLNATAGGIAPFVQGKKPELHFMRLLGWLRKAGLKETGARTFVGNACAPLSDEIRSALISLFQMRWEEAESEVSSKDREQYRRLCQPGSKDFILNLADYYAFFTYTLFYGKVVGY